MIDMPLYVYQVIEPDGSEGEIFEVLQRFSDPALTLHPENGKPVRKLLSTPSAVTRLASGNLSNSNLSKLGFTKYEKAGDGFYEKKAGDGPDVIRK